MDWYQQWCCPWFHQQHKFGNYGCVCQQEIITKALPWSCTSFTGTFPTIRNEGKIYELSSNQHREKTCTWYGCACQQRTIPKALARSCASFGGTFLTKLNEGKIYELRFNQNREKAFTWYASGAGLYDACLVHLVFRWLANKSISGFPNWSKRDLATLSFKDPFFLL